MATLAAQRCEMSLPPTGPAAPSAARRFALAWLFLLVAAALGVALRWQFVAPLPGLNYAFFLHTHSHVAFLGWVGNAYVVASLRHFVPADAAAGYDRLWWLLQVGILGMALTFPFQGYAAASIVFATLHTAAMTVFAVKLWRRNCATAAARPHLRAALGFLLVSGLGPLALGPLAAAGLRDTPAYTLAIYFYLHCQYNGWFLFFLQALTLQRRHEAGTPVATEPAVRAARWLTVGCVLTYALSTLWLQPSPWVLLAAGIGGVAQLVGCGWLLRSVRQPGAGGHGLTGLERFAVGCFLLKHVLQLLAIVPGLVALAHERFVAIAFLHLVFLGIVTPALIAWGQAQGWLGNGGRERGGIGLFLAGAAATEFLLLAPTLAHAGGFALALPLPAALLAGAVVTLLGLLVIGRPRL